MNSRLLACLALASLGGSTGCSTTIRSMTATSWVTPPTGAAVVPVAPAAEGQVTAAPATGGIVSHYYLTYWEGTCTGLTGCSRGETKVKHCKVNADNSLTCNDEAVATKALNP